MCNSRSAVPREWLGQCFAPLPIATLTFSLIHFLQYLHFVVGLMMESVDSQPYTRASMYSENPTAKKLTT
jgi:hypothetical protein